VGYDDEAGDEERSATLLSSSSKESSSASANKAGRKQTLIIPRGKCRRTRRDRKNAIRK
jgi:hypothetical protein